MALTLKPTVLVEVFDMLTQSSIVPKSRYKSCLIIIWYILAQKMLRHIVFYSSILGT